MITPQMEVTATDVAAHYDDLDRFYREVWGEHVHHGLWETGRETVERAVEQLVDRVADDLRITPGSQVCDVGCGYGATARRLASTRGAMVTGLTISRAQFDFAQAASADSDKVRFVLQDWETNTLPSRSFDAVASIECLSHIEQKRSFFSQVHRVLRPGGRAVVTAWLADDEARGWRQRHLLEPICREGRLPGMGTSEECTRFLEQAGLRLLEYHDLSRGVRKTWSICARRLLMLVFTNQEARRYLWRRNSANSIFFLTVFRILAAYHSGAMRYGLFVMENAS